MGVLRNQRLKIYDMTILPNAEGLRPSVKNLKIPGPLNNTVRIQVKDSLVKNNSQHKKATHAWGRKKYLFELENGTC